LGRAIARMNDYYNDAVGQIVLPDNNLHISLTTDDTFAVSR
jgi:hypothetical protein